MASSKEVMFGLFNMRNMEAEKFHNYNGFRYLHFVRNSVFKGSCTDRLFCMSDQSSKGKSIEAERVRKGEIKSSDVCWLYVWIGTVKRFKSKLSFGKYLNWMKNNGKEVGKHYAFSWSERVAIEPYGKYNEIKRIWLGKIGKIKGGENETDIEVMREFNVDSNGTIWIK